MPRETVVKHIKPKRYDPFRKCYESIKIYKSINQSIYNQSKSVNTSNLLKLNWVAIPLLAAGKMIIAR